MARPPATFLLILTTLIESQQGVRPTSQIVCAGKISTEIVMFFCQDNYLVYLEISVFAIAWNCIQIMQIQLILSSCSIVSLHLKNVAVTILLLLLKTKVSVSFIFKPWDDIVCMLHPSQCIYFSACFRDVVRAVLFRTWVFASCCLTVSVSTVLFSHDSNSHSEQSQRAQLWPHKGSRE